jgi:excisionase family DNA binding protein
VYADSSVQNLALHTPEETAMAEKLLSPDEVAEWLDVPKKSLYKWRYESTGPKAYKVGRHIRYRAEDVTRWLEQQASGGE